MAFPDQDDGPVPSAEPLSSVRYSTSERKQGVPGLFSKLDNMMPDKSILTKTRRETVKVAAVQAAPVAFNLAESVSKVAHFTAEAANAGRKWYAKYYDSSIAIPSPQFDVLSSIAKEHNIYLSIGIIEKEGGTLYCTAVQLGRDGKLLYRHRKLIPTAGERLVWGRGAGDGLVVANTDIGKIGGLICWENYMPAARMALYQKGIEIWVAPNADDLPSWTATMQHIAKEGRCFVINSNQFCKVSDFPADYPPFTPDHHDRKPDGSKWVSDDILNRGGSCVVGPLGTFLAEPMWDKEGIIYATLDMEDLTEAKMDFDPVGSYSRPDIFSMTVDTRPSTNVTFQGL
ncbi:MAG: hypothetical protein M1827_002182 [Pycnora praestabilis]|nr:MAG: hypothetical protein M1827_002182 [Pycnora praestabilis]